MAYKKYLIFIVFSCFFCSVADAQKNIHDRFKAIEYTVSSFNCDTIAFKNIISGFILTKGGKEVVIAFYNTNKLLRFSCTTGDLIKVINLPKSITGVEKIALNDLGSILISDISEKTICAYDLDGNFLGEYDYTAPEDWYRKTSTEYDDYLSSHWCPAYYSKPSGEDSITRFSYYYNLFKQNDTIYGIFNNVIEVLYLTDTTDTVGFHSWHNIIPCNIFPTAHLINLDKSNILYASDIHRDGKELNLYWDNRNNPDINKRLSISGYDCYFIDKENIYLLTNSGKGIIIKEIHKVDLVKYIRTQ